MTMVRHLILIVLVIKSVRLIKKLIPANLDYDKSTPGSGICCSPGMPCIYVPESIYFYNTVIMRMSEDICFHIILLQEGYKSVPVFWMLIQAIVTVPESLVFYIRQGIGRFMADDQNMLFICHSQIFL